MESCPDCGFELKLEGSDYHHSRIDEWLDLSFWCGKCYKYKVKRFLFVETHAGLEVHEHYRLTF